MIPMKDKHEGNIRGFHHMSRAWYGPAVLSRGGDVVDSLSIGFYAEGGGTSGEFIIDWIRLGGKVTPRLKAFDDSWDALRLCADLIDRLAIHDEDDPSPDQIVEELLLLGFTDLTEKETPEERRLKPSNSERMREALQEIALGHPNPKMKASETIGLCGDSGERD